jgi:hypothetical protein
VKEAGAHVPSERAEAFHLSPAVRVLAADGRSQERWKSQPDRGVTLVDEHGILRAAAGNHLDVEAGLLAEQRGHARRDVVPTAAQRARRPRERLLGERRAGQEAQQDRRQSECPVASHLVRTV